MKKKVKKAIVILIIICLCLSFVGVGSVFAMNKSVIGNSEKYIISVDEAKKVTDVDCILVLGSYVRNDEPSNMLEDRLIRGLELYNGGVSNRLLMSGDHGKKEYDEVNTMKKYCVDKGIEADTIFLDHAGFSTYDSMYRARDIFGVKKMIIVTQSFHLYRAVYVARALGIDAYGVASDLREYTSKNNILTPIREPLARSKDFMMCVIKPLPVCLGEAIPISGSAELSDDKEYI